VGFFIGRLDRMIGAAFSWIGVSVGDQPGLEADNCQDG